MHGIGDRFHLEKWNTRGLDWHTPLAYNHSMIFIETSLFTSRILMLYAYLKNERENLSPDQIALMREIAKEFKNE